MLKLRKFMCGWFGFLALMFFLLPTIVFWFLLSSANVHGSSLLTRGLMSFFAFTMLLAVPFGMAWWTVKKRKAFARGWAIIASVEMILMSLSSLILMRLPAAYQRHSSNHRPHHFGIFDVLLFALGIAGLISFARRDATEQPVEDAKLPRIAGDGTSNLLDGIAWLLAIAGYIWGMSCWYRWGHAQHLPNTYGYQYWLLFFAAVLIVTIFHETGHAFTGMALRMKLRLFIVGPFQWRIRDGRWIFQFLPSKLLSSGGATGLVPTNPQQSRWNDICMIAAGPLTNLFIGLIALLVALKAKGQPFERYWEFFSLIAMLSLVIFAVNLFPKRLDSQHVAAYSDGAQIYQLLRGGPWADLHRAFSVAQSTMVTPLRPRDYDIDAIQRAELYFTQGRQAFLLRLFASSYFLDQGMLRQASEAVADAERIYKESALDLPAELCIALVYRTAFLRRDAANARQWWERMEAKKPTHFGADYWLAQSALFWIEGRKDEAREAWSKGNVLAQQLPAAGDYEFDRYRYAMLHDCIEKEEINAAT